MTGNGPGIFQYALVSSIIVTFVAGVLGSFLIIRNLSLIGDGLAHVTFGGVVLAWFGRRRSNGLCACIQSVSSLLIHELQTTGILTGDASIAIFLTGVLAFGLVGLSYWRRGYHPYVEGYLFGNILLIYDDSFEIIVWMSIFSMLSIFRHVLLATAIDPISVQIQGIPVKRIGRTFSISHCRSSGKHGASLLGLFWLPPSWLLPLQLLRLYQGAFDRASYGRRFSDYHPQ